MSRFFRQGYRVTNHNLLKLTRRLNDTLAPVRNRLMAREITNYVINIVDGTDQVEVNTDSSFLLHEASRLWDRRNQEYAPSSTFRDPLRCRISFLDTPEGYVLAIPYVSTHHGAAYLEALNTISGMEAFGVNPNYAERTPDDIDRLEVWNSAYWGMNKNHSLLTFELPHTSNPMIATTMDAEVLKTEFESSQSTPMERLRKHLANAAVARTVQMMQDRASEEVHQVVDEYAVYAEMLANQYVVAMDDSTVESIGKLPKALPHRVLNEHMQNVRVTNFAVDDARIEKMAESILYDLVLPD